MYDTVIGMYKASKDSFVSAYESAEAETLAEIEETVEIFKELQKSN